MEIPNELENKLINFYYNMFIKHVNTSYTKGKIPAILYVPEINDSNTIITKPEICT